MNPDQRALVVAHSLACMQMLDRWLMVLQKVDPCGKLLSTAVHMHTVACANYFALINRPDPKVG